MKTTLLLALCLLLTGTAALAQNEDMEGCQDHPVVSRMPQFHIHDCETKEFDAFEFKLGWDAKADDVIVKSVEGRRTHLYYELNEGLPETSALQIFRNYKNAFQKLGAKIYEQWNPNSSYNYLTAVITRNGREVWVMVEPGDTDYHVHIIEVEQMVQQVTASDMLAALDKDGFIALYINFDSGKAVIGADSQGIIDQIYRLLKDNPGLKVGIEGHTDNSGTPEGNRKLSEDRAAAVASALKAKGIAAGRLTSTGWGQDRPIADNRSEEGRAKNRRVEIVKK